MTVYEPLSQEQWDRLLTGDPDGLERLRRPVQLTGRTPFIYPGKGPVVIRVTSDGVKVRLSDGGRLVKFLEAQGMDLSLDMVMSKTVLHAIREIPGAGLGGGEIYLETSPERFSKDVWRFLQALLEIVGLRHAKYKDALVRLSRGGEDLERWHEG